MNNTELLNIIRELKNNNDEMSKKIDLLYKKIYNLTNPHTHTNNSNENIIFLKFDGASRGNPGIGGCGGYIYKIINEKEVIINKYNKFLGNNITNNIAEYNGLLQGFILLEDYFNENKFNECNYKIIVYGDSKLVINQMSNKWKVNNENIKKIYDLLNKYVKKYKCVEFKHIYRNNNKIADQLANKAIDD